MKRIICVILTVVLLASLMAVPTGAAGYTLSIPKTLSSHNLNSFGLRTLNVYRTETPPTIDGSIGEGEYPGPNNGMANSVYVKGETDDGYYSHGLWMLANTAGNMNAYSGNNDFTGYVPEEDVPTKVDTYLTYDEEYLYFAVVYHHFPAQTSGFLLDTRTNFMQSEIPAFCNSSNAWNRYNIGTNVNSHTPSTVYAYSASDSVRSGRVIRMLVDGKDTTRYLDYYVDEHGTAYGSSSGASAPYARAENSYYNIEVLDESFVDGRGNTRNFWTLTFEGRQPLGDILRICDVEYDDGTPIDYVPEWGAWGTALKVFASSDCTGVAPNGTEIFVKYGQPLFAQTMIPTGGMGYTGANSRVGNIEFHNTINGAMGSAFVYGSGWLCNPVHYLGDYMEFDADEFYGSGVDSSSNFIVTTTTRGTRRKELSLKEFDSASARVISVATKASSATGDEFVWIVVAVSAMVVCAGGAAAVVFINRKKRNTVK